MQLLLLLSIHTQIFDGVIALFIVHFDGLGMRAANAITPEDYRFPVLHSPMENQHPSKHQVQECKCNNFKLLGDWFKGKYTV